MTFTIFIVAFIVLLCVFLNKLSSKIGVPMLLGFILLGMIFGVDGVFKIEFDDYEIAEKICSVALIFIIFYGGFGTKWSEAKSVAIKALLLSTVGVVMTATLTALFCFLVLKISILESFLIGAVISSTDAASVFSILRSKKLGLKYHSASLLELESGSNDPCAYMLTMIMLSLMANTASVTKILYLIFAQFIFGALIGGIIASIALFILKRIRFETAGFDMVFVIGIVLLAFALSSMVNGNGYLSVYMVGMIVGNGDIKGKQSLIHFFDGLTGLMQMFVFFLLGLLATPTAIPAILLPSLWIALCITFIARPLTVFAILSPLRCPLPQQCLLSFAGLRGAASIVFAIMALVHDSDMQNDVFHIVFFIVLFSILFQGTWMPKVAKKLDMIDVDEDILKTFNDYSNESSLHFIKLVIKEDHPWLHRAIEDLHLPPETLLAMIIRDQRNLIPNGKTRMMLGDVVVLSGSAFVALPEFGLLEQRIPEHSKWIGKSVVDFSTNPKQLVIMIKRGNEVIIPSGDTLLQEQDTLVINSTKEEEEKKGKQG